MSSTHAEPDGLQRAHTIRSHPAIRAHRRDVARWALANRRPCDRDALAAIVAVRNAFGPGWTDGAQRWTAEEIGRLLWVDLAGWCQDCEKETPDGDRVAATLDTYLRFLSAHRLIARGSDPVAALRRAISDYGGGRSPAHPSVRHALAAVVPIT